MSTRLGSYPPPAYSTIQPESFRGEGSGMNEDQPQQMYSPEYHQQGLRNSSPLEDVYIAVMGSTGAGKSSFIELCTGRDVGVGHKLVSCTTEVEEYQFVYDEMFQVHLVDTPGFDDTNRSDTEVLRDVASWLGTAYEQNIRLCGIIYLHRISDVRMTGTARRNLQMFKKLCGEECFPKIVLATTFWGSVDTATGSAREQELIETENFWGFMTMKGSTVRRHLGSKESAMSILRHIFAQKKGQENIPLAIQREIVEEGIRLDDTAAGRSIDEELRKQRERYEREIRFMQEEKEEALRAKDMAAYEETRKMEQEYEEKLARSLRDSEGLKVNLEAIQLETARKLKLLQEEVERQRLDFETRAQQRGNLDGVSEAEKMEYEQKNNELKRQKKGIYRKLSDLYDKSGEWMEKNPNAVKHMKRFGKFAATVAVHAAKNSANGPPHGSNPPSNSGTRESLTRGVETLFRSAIEQSAQPSMARNDHPGASTSNPISTSDQNPFGSHGLPQDIASSHTPPPPPPPPNIPFTQTNVSAAFNPSPGMARGPNPLNLPTTGQLGVDIILDQWNKQVAWKIGAMWPGPNIWSRFNDPSWPDDLTRFVKVRDEQTGVEYWARPFSGTVEAGRWVSWR